MAQRDGDSKQTAGDPIPPQCTLIEVRVAELRQLFNAIDPAPFRERDLDPDAAEFIIEWAREAPRDAPLALQVHLERPAGLPNEAELLGESVRQYFAGRGKESRRRLRRLFQIGRISLLIGLLAIAVLSAAAQLIVKRMGEGGLGSVLRESLLIGGWVAMWRPLEIFLYDWWPIRAEARLLNRLAMIPVRIQYVTSGQAERWRTDWPAAPAASPTPQPQSASSSERRPDELIRGGIPRPGLP